VLLLLMVSQLQPSVQPSVQSSLRPMAADPSPQPIFQLELPVVEGLIQVFTAAHRGFFSGVMAQALRTAGQGTPVLVVQFLKGGCGQGPAAPVQLCQHLDWVRLGAPLCVDSPDPGEEARQAIAQLWEYTRQAVMVGGYGLVVLDELSVAVHLGLIDEAEVLELLRLRPHHIDVVLTGPEMPESLRAIADQITELRRN
jgi:cob(I)alamin adenosyltransferase